MQLSKARIANFRSLRDVEVDFGSHTAFIGGNGAGKSSIIRALDRFFSPQKVLQADDFFGRDQSSSIEIELTFTNLSADEKEEFKSRVRDEKLVVTRVFSTGQESGSFYGSTLMNPEFAEIRSTSGAMPKRAAYNALRATPKYSTMPAGSSVAVVEQGMIEWENAHVNELVLGRDDGRFFGFSNASRTAIGRYISFVFIPAVREAMVDAADGRNSAIGKLMELLVRSAILKRKEVAQFREKINKEYQELISPENMPELGALAKILSDDIKQLYADADVGLNWRPAGDMDVPLPSADVTLTDVGFGGPVDRQGHGLQRAFIFTLLQQLAKASVSVPEIEAPVVEGDEPNEEEAKLTRAPNLILAIEEPELYQHPTKQRHFSTVLRGLSNKALPGAEGNTQVVLASHSPLFVSMPNVSEIRFVRRIDCEGQDFKECHLTALDLEVVAEKIGNCHQKPKGVVTSATLLPRLHILGAELAEGFFADAVVLVEGRSDKAALYAASSLRKLNFEGQGIAVLPVDGKNNLDRPYLIFKELGIPTFIIWDCDGESSGANLALIRAAEPDIDHKTDTPTTQIGNAFARFEKKLEVTLKEELSEEIFDKARNLVCDELDVDPGKDVEKNPVVMTRILEEAVKAGKISATVDAIVLAIWRDLKGIEIET